MNKFSKITYGNMLLALVWHVQEGDLHAQACESVITGPSVVRSCEHDTLLFDASLSSPSPGSTIASYAWDFADGTTGAGAIDTHVFASLGAYRVRLIVTDDIGCADTSSTLVLSARRFGAGITGTASSLCMGDTVRFDAQFHPWSANFVVQPVDTPAAQQVLNVLDTVSISQSVSQFGPNELLTDPGNIGGICVSLEHSSMSELMIYLSCPNGQTVVLHNSGGDNTDIGHPSPFEPDAYGCCWNYCWTSDPEFSTWMNAAQSGTEPHVLANLNNVGTSLVPGTYASAETLDNLIGCPLNGEWTFTFIDLGGLDNAWICSAAVAFIAADMPDLSFPAVTAIAPHIGTGCDSTQWTGPWIVPDPIQCDPMAAVPPMAGAFTYVLHTRDDHGCMHEIAREVDLTYVQTTIHGEETPVLGDVVPYAIEGTDGGTCYWVAHGGTLASVPYTRNVLIQWSEMEGSWVAMSLIKNGCVAVDTLFVGPLPLTDGLSFGPVPADDELIVRSAERSIIKKLRILDAAGRIVREADDLQPTTVISTSTMPTGVYTLEVTQATGSTLHVFTVFHE